MKPPSKKTTLTSMDLQLARDLEDSRAYAACLHRELAQVKRQVDATQRLIEETRAACDRMSRVLANLYACGFGTDRQQTQGRPSIAIS